MHSSLHTLSAFLISAFTRPGGKSGVRLINRYVRLVLDHFPPVNESFDIIIIMMMMMKMMTTTMITMTITTTMMMT